jgi:hypothetical protein
LLPKHSRCKPEALFNVLCDVIDWQAGHMF